MNKIKSNKGFTIIEVVLVLAIAGLIFLMVFVALPNLQRSQRDTQRRDDYVALASNITAYISNNGGKLPTLPSSGSVQFDASVYINSDGKSADGEYYELTIVSYETFNILFGESSTNTLSGKANTTHNAAYVPLRGAVSGEGDAAVTDRHTFGTDDKTTRVYVVEKANCEGSFTSDATARPKKITSGGDRKFAIYGALETGSYCQAE